MRKIFIACSLIFVGMVSCTNNNSNDTNSDDSESAVNSANTTTEVASDNSNNGSQAESSKNEDVGRGQSESSEFSNYEGTGYNISYPSEWTQQNNGATILFMTKKEGSGDSFQENVNVLIQDLSAQPMTLDQYVSMSKQQIVGALGESAILSSSRIKLFEVLAEEIIYNMNYQGRNLKIKSIWLVADNKAYVLTYTASPDRYEEHLDMATKTMHSFKLHSGKAV